MKIHHCSLFLFPFLFPTNENTHQQNFHVRAATTTAPIVVEQQQQKQQVCNPPVALSASYLKAQSAGGGFVPAAYFAGGSVKYIAVTAGLEKTQEIFDDELCVDGGTEPTAIQLYDDGTRGDDIAGDGIFSRSCIHFCPAAVDLTDLFGFAFERNMYGLGRLVVLQADLQGQIPSVALPTPLHPAAQLWATSHAAFFVDESRTLLPQWPTSVENIAEPTGRNVVVGALLAVFGDVFDYLTVSSYETQQRAIQGWGIYKYQRWEQAGGPQPEAKLGETEECIIGMSGVPTPRLLGVTIAQEVVSDFNGLLHELIHGTAGYEYHRNLDAARTGDGAHVPGSCTVDHSPLQGPIWDWVKGSPTGIPLGYCLGDDECFSEAGDVVRLEANDDCATCPDDQLSSCCSFRYEDALATRSQMLARPSLHQMSSLMLYISGFITYEEMVQQRPAKETTYYCMGSDTDGGCGSTPEASSPCTANVDDSDRSRVTSDFVSRFTFQDLVDANGGPRSPPLRAEPDLRHGVILVGQRVPSEAEMTLYTMIFRHHEVQDTPWPRNEKRGRKMPATTWQYTSQGYSTLHSRFHGIDCGGGLVVPSCNNNTGPGGNTCSNKILCSEHADCHELDGRPFCLCHTGFVGDGTLCVDPVTTVSYPQNSAHQLYVDQADLCFGPNTNWPAFVAESDLPIYPGGVYPYGLQVCSPSCGEGFFCRNGLCVGMEGVEDNESCHSGPLVCFWLLIMEFIFFCF